MNEGNWGGRYMIKAKKEREED
jgi:hypothetical protein